MADEYDTNDEAQVKERKTRAQLDQERATAVLARVLDSSHGREVIWGILEKAGFHQLSFCGEETHKTAFKEGRRSLGNELLLECLTARPQCYNVMRDEAEARKANQGKS